MINPTIGTKQFEPKVYAVPNYELNTDIEDEVYRGYKIHRNNMDNLITILSISGKALPTALKDKAFTRNDLARECIDNFLKDVV